MDDVGKYNVQPCSMGMCLVSELVGMKKRSSTFLLPVYGGNKLRCILNCSGNNGMKFYK